MYRSKLTFFTQWPTGQYTNFFHWTVIKLRILHTTLHFFTISLTKFAFYTQFIGKIRFFSAISWPNLPTIFWRNSYIFFFVAALKRNVFSTILWKNVRFFFCVILSLNCLFFIGKIDFFRHYLLKFAILFLNFRTNDWFLKKI